MLSQRLERGYLAQRAFVFKVAINFGIATLAYFLSLRFVFPGYVAPLAAFHADMYIPANLAASGLTMWDVLHWPRPLTYLVALAGGHLGFEGSIVFFTTITLLALALAISITEVYYLRKSLPWWLALATLVYAMSAPSFYFSTGYDVGTSLAMLFGLLGIWAWESNSHNIRALLIMGIFFTLSTLSKESFIPVLGIYVVASAWQNRRSRLISRPSPGPCVLSG